VELPEKTSGDGMKKLAACLLLAVVIGSVYYNALGNSFVFDDYLLVVNRAAIPRVASRPLLAFSPAALGYRPLRTLSYVLDYRVGGMRPWIFHLNNLVYHWIAACLVFFVTLGLVTREKVVSSQLSVVSPLDSGVRTALFTALLWSVHPIQTDAVTYISGRRDILSGLFFFLGLYAFLRLRAPSQQPSSPGRRASWFLLAVLAYGLGLLSKEMAVTLPLVMLSYDYIYELRLQEMRWGWTDVRALGRGIARTVWGHKYLYLPLLLGGVGFSWYAAFVALPVWRVGWYGGSIVTNFLTTARIWVYYLYLLLWPMPLLADYTGAFPVVHSLLDPWAWAAVGFLLVLFLLTLSMMRYARLAAFSGLWFAITLLPVSHIIPYPEMLAEHYLYLPSFGFCLLVALLLARLTQSPKPKVQNPKSEKEAPVSSLRSPVSSLWKPMVGYSLFVALVAFYAERTVIRNRDWRDDLTFYNRVVRDNPYSPRARLGLGYAYDRGGLPRMAIIQYKAGLKLDPQDPRLYTNLGAAHQKLGELRAAEEVYKAALKLHAPDSNILINLGFLYSEKGEFDKARSALERAERLSKGRDSAVYANFGLLYELQNKLPEALAAYQKARALEPKNEVYAQKITALEENLAKQGQGAGDQVERGPLGSPQGALTH
jgi:tetratricopeptide (TPR) repeat protein